MTVLIVAKCIVNDIMVIQGHMGVVRINSSKVYCKCNNIK